MHTSLHSCLKKGKHSLAQSLFYSEKNQQHMNIKRREHYKLSLYVQLGYLSTGQYTVLLAAIEMI